MTRYILGTGDHTYEAIHPFGKLPSGMDFDNVSHIATDSSKCHNAVRLSSQNERGWASRCRWWRGVGVLRGDCDFITNFPVLHEFFDHASLRAANVRDMFLSTRCRNQTSK